MAQLTQFILASSILLSFASAQSTTVTQIFFPLADPQPLDASIIGQSAGATTILMNCAPNSTSDECGFPTPITLTVGPSTLNYQPSGLYQVLGSIDCKITASTVADCTVASGIYSDDSASTASQTEDAYITTPAASSTTTSDILSGTDVSWLEITITAGLEKATSAASSSGSGVTTGTGSAASASRTRTASGTGPSTAATASGNMAAGPLRDPYTGLGVAAVLIAGSMMLL